MPWWDDLYLDVAVLPNGEVYVLDEDELDEARDSGVIPEEHHALAWAETNRLIGLTQGGSYGPLQTAWGCRERLFPLLR